MSKDSETPIERKAPTPAELEPDGRKLDTLGDVRRALAMVCRRIENYSLDHKTGHTLIMGLNCLASVMQDQRDSVWTKRAKVLWLEREAASAQPVADH